MATKTTGNECKERYAQGLPANHLLIIDPLHIILTTPKGALTLRWVAERLETYNSHELRITALLAERIEDILAQVRPARYERKHGWEIARLPEEERHGWTWIGDAHSEDEHNVALYERVVDPGLTGDLWFGRDEIVS